MLAEVVPLVQRLVPGLLTQSTPSVACIYATHAKYLVFDADPLRPACVVEFGHGERLQRVNGVLAELQPRMANIVPRPLLCAPWRGDTWVSIQEGVAGMPWFRIADACHSASDWRDLLGRAILSMSRLHAATAQEPRWVGPVTVRTELARQLALLAASGHTLSATATARAAEWSAALGARPVTGVWQHGDFSLNNVLISNDRVAVIDFEEFGGTLVPLHDAFGLALSLPLSQAGRCPISLAECVDLCVQPALSAGLAAREQLPGLLLHHLVWRINRGASLDRRAALRTRLLTWVEEFAACPATFLGTLAVDARLAV